MRNPPPPNTNLGSFTVSKNCKILVYCFLFSAANKVTLCSVVSGLVSAFLHVQFLGAVLGLGVSLQPSHAENYERTGC